MHMLLVSIGESLISRPRGAAIRARVLSETTGNTPIVLDFEGVAHASYSFIDELVGNLATMHQRGALAAEVSVVNTSDVVGRHVERCFAVRGINAPAIVA